MAVGGDDPTDTGGLHDGNMNGISGWQEGMRLLELLAITGQRLCEV